MVTMEQLSSTFAWGARLDYIGNLVSIFIGKSIHLIQHQNDYCMLNWNSHWWSSNDSVEIELGFCVTFLHKE